MINPDAFATGFGERMRTFSQEKRALNHVRIVSRRWGGGGGYASVDPDKPILVAGNP